MPRMCNAVIVFAWLALADAAQAQTSWGSNFEQFDQQRRQAIAGQIGLQDYLRWQSGLPSRLYAGRPYSLESIYSGLAYSPGPAAPWKTDVFEPWPLVPGDIFGRQFDGAVAQPSGDRVTPLGPNGYTYEPTYGWPTPWRQPALNTSPPTPLPATPLPRPQPWPSSPAPQAPRAEEIPAPQPNSALREF